MPKTNIINLQNLLYLSINCLSKLLGSLPFLINKASHPSVSRRSAGVLNGISRFSRNNTLLIFGNHMSLFEFVPGSLIHCCTFIDGDA